MISVVDSVYLSYFDALVSSEPINLILKSFWVIGELKMGFLDEIGLEIVSYNSAQMSARSSELPVAQASDSLHAQSEILVARLSEPRANPERAKSQPSSFASLKRNTRRLSERRQFLPRILELACSLKRTRSEQ